MPRYELHSSSAIQDRTALTPKDIIADIWLHLGLPPSALEAIDLQGDDHVFRSSFRIADLAQASVALSALAAALVRSVRNDCVVPAVTVERRHAAVEFASERLYTIEGVAAESAWGPIGGLFEAKDGYVRMHDGFPNLANAALNILGLPWNATRDQVGLKVKEWKAGDLEEAAARNKAVIYRLRTYEEWDASPQEKALPDYPVMLRKLSRENGLAIQHESGAADRCLENIRVLDLSRVIAAPVAGRTLAVHGADVLWITSPSLPSIPAIDKDVNRGKRSAHLDLQSAEDFAKLEELIKGTDVFIQAYRPGALAAKGLTSERLAQLRPGIVVANMSAWGHEGPWKENRGFDSIVQTASGVNNSEYQHFGSGSEPARPMPVQALDHAAGYLLATGISAALYKRDVEGGSWEVNVSLAGVMKYLRSLGQLPGRQGFGEDGTSPEELLAHAVQNGREDEYMEEAMSGFGMVKAVRHSAKIEGVNMGFHVMPGPLGGDKPEWSRSTKSGRILCDLSMQY